MIRTLLLASIFLCLAHSVLFSQTDEPKPPAAQNTAEQQAPAANTSPQPAAAPVAPAQTQTTAKTPKGFVLEDGTPVRLKTGRSISSADAHVGDTLDFEVLEDVRVAGLLVIPKGGIAFATVTEAQSKRRMARGGKLNVNIDSVRLITHEKAALRAVKEVKGGGHTGVMTGGIVATSIVFFPAAPFFLFMHGKDVTIPKGTEITAYINGDTRLDEAKFQPAKTGSIASPVEGTAGTAQIDIASTPPGADIEIDGKFVGSTPSSITVAQGDHEIAVKKNGFAVWDRKVSVSSGHININA